MSKTKKATRADGRLRTTFTYEGKRYYIYGTTKKELREKELLKLQELQDGKLRRENPTMDEYFEGFLDRYRLKVGSNTCRIRQQRYQTCAEIEIHGKRLGDFRIRDIRPADVQELQRQLVKKKIKSSTINFYMQSFSQVLNAAVKDETIDRNPCRAVDPVKRTEPKARETIHRALSEKETKIFLDAAKTSHFYNAYRLMLNTGLRIGEVGALVPSDVDLKAGMLHVTKTLTRSEAGGAKVGDTPKTSAGNRDIPLTKQIIAIIRDQQEINAVIQFNGGRQIFRCPRRGLMYEHSANRDLYRICEETGLAHFTCHALRATFATRFIEQRPNDYKVLQEILGHSDIHLTLNLYTHVMRDRKVEAMKALDLAF